MALSTDFQNKVANQNNDRLERLMIFAIAVQVMLASKHQVRYVKIQSLIVFLDGNPAVRLCAFL